MKTFFTFLIFCLLISYTKLQAQSGQQITFYGNSWTTGNDVEVTCGTNYFYVSAVYNRAGGGSATMSISPSDVSAPSGYSWSNFNGSPYTLTVSTNSSPQVGDFVVTARDGSYSYTFTLHLRSAPHFQIANGGNGPALSANSSGTVAGFVNQSIQPYSYVTWYASDGLRVEGGSSYVMQNSGDNFSVNVSTTSYGGTLYAIATNACGSGVYPPVVLTLGPPYIAYTTVNGSPGSSATVSSVATLALITNGSATSANWSVTNGSGSISASGTSCNAYPSTFLRVVGAPTNSNGTGPEATFYIWKDGYSGYRMAYPNPTKNNLTIEFDNAQMAQELVKEVTLYNEKGKAVKVFDASRSASYFKESKSVIFDVQDLPKSTYFLHIQIGEKQYKDQIVVE